MARLQVTIRDYVFDASLKGLKPLKQAEKIELALIELDQKAKV